MLLFYRKNMPVINVLFGAFAISFSPVFVKLAQVPPLTSAFYRVFFGAILLFACATVAREWEKMNPLGWIICLLAGLIFAFDLFFWHKAIFFIGPGLATLLGNLQVFILAAVGTIFLGEKLRPRFVIAIPLALIGLYFIVGLDWRELGAEYKIGVFLGLLTAIFYSMFLLLMRKLQSDHQKSHFFVLLLISTFCAIFLSIEMVSADISFAIPDPTSLFSLLGLGIISQTFGWVLIATSMPKIKASFTGLILLLQPTLAFIWDVLFFARPTDLLNWSGVLLTLTAIYMGLTGKRSAK
jgi:drug/metabolite transporter (DMT)-like permease